MILKVGYTSVQCSDSVAHEATTNSIDCRLNSELRANKDNKSFCCSKYECVKKKLAGPDVS